MADHLTLVKNKKTVASGDKAGIPDFSGMAVIEVQALLMEAASATFRAIKSGEIANILTGLVSLAYTALEALSALGANDIIESSEACNAYQMLTIVQLLSEKIGCCASGQASNYSALYHLCRALASNFLNADFDKSFLVYHEWRKANPDLADICFKTELGCLISAPDLTDCLYE